MGACKKNDLMIVWFFLQAPADIIHDVRTATIASGKHLSVSMVVRCARIFSRNGSDAIRQILRPEADHSGAKTLKLFTGVG